MNARWPIGFGMIGWAGRTPLLLALLLAGGLSADTSEVKGEPPRPATKPPADLIVAVVPFASVTQHALVSYRVAPRTWLGLSVAQARPQSNGDLAYGYFPGYFAGDGYGLPLLVRWSVREKPGIAAQGRYYLEEETQSGGLIYSLYGSFLLGRHFGYTVKEETTASLVATRNRPLRAPALSVTFDVEPYYFAGLGVGLELGLSAFASGLFVAGELGVSQPLAPRLRKYAFNDPGRPYAEQLGPAELLASRESAGTGRAYLPTRMFVVIFVGYRLKL